MLLGLAWIYNVWDDRPVVEHVDVRAVTFEELWHYLRRAPRAKRGTS